MSEQHQRVEHIPMLQTADQSLMMVTYDYHPQKQHSSKGNITAIAGFFAGSTQLLLFTLPAWFSVYICEHDRLFYLSQILFVLSPLSLIMGVLGLIFSMRSLKYPRHKALAIAGLIFASVALAMFLLGLVYILISYLMTTRPQPIQSTPVYPASS